MAARPDRERDRGRDRAHGVFAAVNFLGIRKLARTNSAVTWWKVGVPVLTIVALAATQFHTSNLTAADGFSPYGAHGILAAVSTAGIIFALLGFEQADQLAGESANPGRDMPRAVIGAITIGVVIYILLQVVFLAALPAAQLRGTWASAGYTNFSGPFAQLAVARRARLARGDHLHRRRHLAGRDRADLHDRELARVLRPQPQRLRPRRLREGRREGIPWVGLITAFVAGCICFLPFPSWRSLVGLITSASVLMYAGAPLALGGLRSACPRPSGPYRLPAARVLAPLAFAVANLLILWSGWTTDYKLGIAILIGYGVLAANRLLKLNPHTPVLNWRAASWLPVISWGWA